MGEVEGWGEVVVLGAVVDGGGWVEGCILRVVRVSDKFAVDVEGALGVVRDWGDGGDEDGAHERMREVRFPVRGGTVQGVR